MKLHLSVFRDFWKLFFKKTVVSKIHCLCEGRIEKYVHWDHRLSSIGKPRDAKWWSLGRLFLFYPHTHDTFFYYIKLFGKQKRILFQDGHHGSRYRAGEGISEPLSDILYNMLSDELFKHPATQIESLVLSCR